MFFSLSSKIATLKILRGEYKMEHRRHFNMENNLIFSNKVSNILQNKKNALLFKFLL